MNCLAIIFLAYLAINSGSSSALSEISDSPSKKNYTAEELGTCPMNSSIPVKIFRNLKGEWLTTIVDGNKLRNFTRSMDLNLEKNVLECGDSRYITISNFLKDTDAGNSSEATVGYYRNNTDGEVNDSCKRMKTMEDRMTSVENTLNIMNGTLTNVKESHANVENTLKAIEETVNQLNTMFKSKPGYGYTTYFDAIYKGKQMRFSANLRTAWRTKPTENKYHGTVVSNFLLEEDQVFQIRIDETIDEWSGYGIAIGVIEEKTEGMKDAYNIYDRYIKGTWAIRSSTGPPSGKCNTYKDGNTITENGYPFQTNRLPVGTLLGVSRRSNGSLHFYHNGVDKGAAFVNIPKYVYGFLEVIAYVTKISITT